ncbi:MAG: hypothetical protein CMJ59_05765 [Planctomycetaceae bacterium]|nr:hypothetical protein [Planctomycetaceae bacterium]
MSAMNRRNLVQAGAAGSLGLGIAQLEALRALAVPHQKSAPAKSVIFVYAVGGMSQLETFDMKPGAPQETRGEFRPIQTTTSGIEICEHLPMLAKQSHLYSLVRSVSHPYTGHGQGHMVMQSGRTTLPAGFTSRAKRTDWPSIAAKAGYATKSRNNLPQALVLPELCDNEGLVSGQTAGLMGPRHDPWLVKASGTSKEFEWGPCPDCFHYEDKGFKKHRCAANPVFETPKLGLPNDVNGKRLAGRFDLVERIGLGQGQLERTEATISFDRYRQRAITLLTRGKTRRAFDVRNAPDKVQDRYGRNKFGWSLLMARRLVEVGVNIVQVNLGHTGTWDTHQQQFPVLKQRLLPPTDQAVSALLEDLDHSGQLKDVLVVLASEFGRTPRIFVPKGAKTGLPGRDHWGPVQTVLFAGGGVRGGRVIGETDRQGAYPAEAKKTPEDFAATIYHAMGIPATASWYDETDRPNHIYGGKPIAELL